MENKKIGVKSKVFYARAMLKWIIYFVITGPIILFIVGTKNESFMGGLLTVVLLLIFHGVFWFLVKKSKDSFYIFVNEDSVGFYSGFLPWTKGYNEIKWKDLDEALLYQGFISYALNSYNIILVHNKLIDKKLIIRDIQNGKEIVKKINELLLEKNKKTN